MSHASVVARAVLVAVALVLFFASRAPAQDARDAAETEALFARGATALSEGRFPEAARIFEDVLARTPHRGAAFNLAVALRGQGRMTRAARVLRALLDDDYGDLGTEQRGAVETMLAEVERSLVPVAIRVRGARDGVIAIDAREVARLDGAATIRQRVDPGPHLVEVTTPDGRSARRRIEAGAVPGAEVTVELAVPPKAEPRESDEGGGVLRSPWTWLVVGALVAGGIALAIVLVTTSDEPLNDDFLGGQVEVLTW